MYVLTKKFRFEAAHSLVQHDGKCARLHGHSWNGALYVAKRTVETSGPKTNMVLDYGDISARLSPLIDHKLDHYYLNVVLDTDAPTSEFIAKWLYDALRPLFPASCGIAVQIEETCTSACLYDPEFIWAQAPLDEKDLGRVAAQ